MIPASPNFSLKVFNIERKNGKRNMRKPIALLVAGSMTLMPLLGAASVVLTPVSEAYAAPIVP